MINLIPNREKKEMRRGFYYKLAVLFLGMCSISVFIFLVAMLPSYFLSSTQKSIASGKLKSQKSEPVPEPDQETLLVIKDLDNKLGLAERSQNDKFIISEKVVNSILLRKLPDIRITDISYENDPAKGPGGRKISIEGIAPSREALLMFRQALEDSGSFKQVELPISNFIKGSNIQFYLNLIPE